MRQRLLAGALIAVALAVASPLLAASPVVVVEGASGPIASRVRDELEGLGLGETYTRDEARGGRRADAMERAAMRTGARLALRVGAGRVIEVWARDETSGHMMLREVLDAGDERGSDAERTLALRAAEVVRASLRTTGKPGPAKVVASLKVERSLPIPIAVTRPGPPDTAVSAARSVAEPALALAPPAPSDGGATTELTSSKGHTLRWPRFAAEAGAAVTLGVGGLAPAFGARVGLHVMPSKYLGASLHGALPVVPIHVSESEGGANVRLAMLGAGARLELPKGDFAASLSAGLSLVWLRVQGAETRAGYVPREDSTVAFGPHVGAGATYAFSTAAALGLDFTLGATFRRMDVLFAERTVASFGQPYVLASLSILIGDVSRPPGLPRQSR